MAKKQEKDLVPNEGNARKIKHLRFEYGVEEPNPQSSKGEKRIAFRTARQGMVVEIPREIDRERGEKFGAFHTDEELERESAGATPDGRSIAQLNERELVAWIEETHPSVNEVLEASDGDARLAQRLLDAETAATDGDPRKGVLEGLAKVIDRGE